MLDEAIKSKLRDPAYLDLHLAALGVLKNVGDNRWYDDCFVRFYEAGKAYLALVRPEAVGQFIDGFDPLRASSDFTIARLPDLFDAQTHAEIIAISEAVPRDYNDAQELDEYQYFDRKVVWDQPFFVELQRRLLPRVSDIIGTDLVMGYNFLSLYGGAGKCDPHMDEPRSMFTLDYCIAQSDEWPIWFSKHVGWPTAERMRDFDPDGIKNDPALDWQAHILRPNQALLFNGSSQWHYRNDITPGGFCNLLFFHYFPAGGEKLIKPHTWPDHLGIPELEPLCDFYPYAH